MASLFKTTLLSVFISISSFSFSQTSQKKEHPIDAQYQTCIGENQTTIGMIECAHAAEKSWDTELNKYYKQLTTILSVDEKAKLQKAQISWIAFRDNEKLFAGTTYYNLQGTMWHVAAAEREMEIVKTRTLELKNYYEVLKDNK